MTETNTSQTGDQIEILFINNDGGGFAGRKSVAKGTTLEQLLRQELPESSASSLLIRVNRQPSTSDYVLQPGDRVSASPVKIEGAVEAAIDVRLVEIEHAA